MKRVEENREIAGERKQTSPRTDCLMLMMSVLFHEHTIMTTACVNDVCNAVRVNNSYLHVNRILCFFHGHINNIIIFTARIHIGRQKLVLI